MLKKLQELRATLNEDQKKMLHSAFPEDIVKQFFSADDEQSAVAVIESLNKYLDARPMVVIKLYRDLLPAQRAIILDLAFEEEE